jgi:hypothetical protein
MSRSPGGPNNPSQPNASLLARSHGAESKKLLGLHPTLTNKKEDRDVTIPESRDELMRTTLALAYLGRLHFGKGLVFENSVENPACREADEVETLEQQLRIAAM